jgi:hypothetical protein
MTVVQLYLFWNIFSIARGVFIAETYWDWRALGQNALNLLIPITAYAASNIILMQVILSFYIKYTLPLFLVFAFLIAKGAYGFYLVPMSFLVLFLPVLTFRWKMIILAFTIVAITADIGARSHVIKFGIPVLLVSLFYLRSLITNKILEWVRKLFFILPLILFSLAVTDVFNVFNMHEYIKGDYVHKDKYLNGEIIDDDLKDDSRSFLYIEVLQTAQKYNFWWIGRSPARGNESDNFGWIDDSNRGERIGNEVGILNIFVWTGIVGVILYLMVFYRASYLAVNQSNNIFSKMLGLFLAFRWVYAWVEDPNYFSLSYVFLWLTIGLCFSKSFRAMTNIEVKYWVRGIFDNRYVTYSIKTPTRVNYLTILDNRKK